MIESCKWLVQYIHEGLLENNSWAPCMDGGFISRICSRQELDSWIESNFVSNNNTRYRDIVIYPICSQEKENSILRNLGRLNLLQTIFRPIPRK
jgi:hypothetical protein